MNKKQFLSVIGLIIVVILWGIAPVISKYLFDNGYYSPALLVAIRGLLACVGMLVFILITKGFKDVNRSYLICIPAGVILAIAYLVQFIGLETTTPAKNTFLESLSCIAVPVCMFIFVREKPTLSNILAVIGVCVGSFVLCGNGLDFTSMFTTPTIGDILSSIGGIFFGIDIAFTKVFAKNKNAAVFVFFQFIILTIVSFAYALPFEKNLAMSWKFTHILIVLVLGILCTAVCWVLRTVSIRNVSAVTCAILMPMSAVVAASTSILFHVEQFSWNVVIGGLIILGAIIASGVYDVYKEKQKALEQEEKKEEAVSNEQN